MWAPKKISLQLSSVSGDLVLKSLIRAHEIIYFNDAVSRTPRWQALVSKSDIDKHLDLISEIVNS